jgi:periplasmic protein TonB
MSASTSSPPPKAPEPRSGSGVVSSGWLSDQGGYQHVPRRLRESVGISLVLYGGLLLLVLFVSFGPGNQIVQDMIPVKMVFLDQPGPGGGGGGSPAPAPPKKMEVPHHKVPDPVPIPTPVPPPPPPVLTAPVETNMTDMLQASGVSSVSLASYGGGGQGTGIGPGKGSGVGPGTGGGFGGGAFRPGAGVSSPTLLKQVEPKYTSDAMRAKIQGDVYLDVVVLANGTVGDVRVAKSLDDKFGLDQEAIKAARQWLFRPGTDHDGKPQPTLVTLILSFRLH